LPAGGDAYPQSVQTSTLRSSPTDIQSTSTNSVSCNICTTPNPTPGVLHQQILQQSAPQPIFGFVLVFTGVPWLCGRLCLAFAPHGSIHSSLISNSFLIRKCEGYSLHDGAINRSMWSRPAKTAPTPQPPVAVQSQVRSDPLPLAFTSLCCIDIS
jgi:hypothetical protein